MSPKTPGLTHNAGFFITVTAAMVILVCTTKSISWLIGPKMRQRRRDTAAAYCETLLELEAEQRALGASSSDPAMQQI